MTASELIKSGIIELYLLGLASLSETEAVERMAAEDADVKRELEEIKQALRVYTKHALKEPNPAVKTSVMAAIDYMERLKNGEQAGQPDELTERSVLSDYEKWLRDTKLKFSCEEDIELRIIGKTNQMVSGLLRIVSGTPYEVHDREIEKFLIVEGSCDIVTNEATYSLKLGDYFAVPLNVGHEVKVTSAVPCVAIWQRVAA